MPETEKLLLARYRQKSDLQRHQTHQAITSSREAVARSFRCRPVQGCKHTRPRASLRAGPVQRPSMAPPFAARTTRSSASARAQATARHARSRSLAPEESGQSCRGVGLGRDLFRLPWLWVLILHTHTPRRFLMTPCLPASFTSHSTSSILERVERHSYTSARCSEWPHAVYWARQYQQFLDKWTYSPGEKKRHRTVAAPFRLTVPA